MARTKDREKAIVLREQGMSYSQIKEKLGISKSTLSSWLRDMPLSTERLKELRDTSEVRIEKTRATKKKKKEDRRRCVYEKVAKDIEQSKDTEFVAGFYLYWGEGTKTAEYTVSLTNSDPAVIRCFVLWLKNFDITTDMLRVKLHIYADQDERSVKHFWSEVTGVEVCNFYKSYVKASRSDSKSYKGMFTNGTCSVVYHSRDVYEYVIQGIKYLRDKYGIAD